MDIEQLTSFLGWVSVINIAFLIASSLLIVMLKHPISRMHAKMFSLKEEDVLKMYFQYLGRFKILIIAFNLAPYLALRVML
ncbi:MAG: hypothetical protein JKY11_01935 [Alphaproteobacteria bacterium]|nr:hypothetical protein [Alphaproteobacteria bacterium]